ncbi:MAG TPA: lipoprotein LpqH [Mycobacterium sp.]|nr:lipoprotein LpqH [Mycobacterium sp.]
MKQSLLVAVGGTAIVVAGLAGCSSGDKSSSGSSPSSAAASTGTTVTIDGQPKDVGGSVVCATVGGNVNVAIGEAMTGIAAVISDGDSPTVTSVALGNVNGITLAVGGGQGDATATKDGKSYKITGNAVGVDMANPMQPAKKPFELDFTCP